MTPARPPAPPADPSARPWRVGFVPGVTPDKWARRWAERMPRGSLELAPVDDDPVARLLDGDQDMCLLRLPVPEAAREVLHLIPLYTETAVVVVPRGHFVEAADEVTLADLTDEHHHAVPPLTPRQAVETVAAGVGVVVLPSSLARLNARKDVASRPVVDAETSTVALGWRRDLDDPRVETFVGVVRGRTVNSTRGTRGTQGRTSEQRTPERRTPERRGRGSRRRRG